MLLWGGEQVALPATGTEPLAWHWGASEIAIDLWHHTVYAYATSTAYECLDRY